MEAICARHVLLTTVPNTGALLVFQTTHQSSVASHKTADTPASTMYCSQVPLDYCEISHRHM